MVCRAPDFETHQYTHVLPSQWKMWEKISKDHICTCMMIYDCITQAPPPPRQPRDGPSKDPPKGSSSWEQLQMNYKEVHFCPQHCEHKGQNPANPNQSTVEVKNEWNNTVCTLFQSSQLLAKALLHRSTKKHHGGLSFSSSSRSSHGRWSSCRTAPAFTKRQLRIHVSWLPWQPSTGEQADLTSQMKTDHLETLGQLSQESPTCEDVLVPSPGAAWTWEMWMFWQELPRDSTQKTVRTCENPFLVSGTTVVDRPRHLWARFATCETCTAPVLTSSDPQIASNMVSCFMSMQDEIGYSMTCLRTPAILKQSKGSWVCFNQASVYPGISESTVASQRRRATWAKKSAWKEAKTRSGMSS